MRLVRSLLLATLAVGATVLISSDQVSHAIKPDKVTALEVYAKDGKPVEDKRLQFAVVGSTRGIGAGAQAEPKPPLDIIADLRTQAAVRGLDFVLLTGGYTRRSTPDEWNRFARRWKDVLQMRLQSDNKGRKHVLAVPGDAEILGDRKLTGFGAVFPGSSAGIGFNRNASWGKVDAVVGKTRWRILLLDTHQKAMGSRWKEQLFWLPKAVSDGEFDKLIVVMPDPRVTMAENTKMDPGDGPSQMIDIIEEYAPLNALTLVVSGGPSTNEILLPTGAFGEAYLVAGNAGIGGPTLLQATAADEAGYKDVGLEPLYTVALMKEFDHQAETESFREDIIDKAKSRGNWETYTPRFDGDAFPVQGWWHVTVDPKGIELIFRMRRPDGTLHDLYRTRREDRGGWKVLPVGD